MCFTMGMSAFFGAVAFSWAFIEWRNFRCPQYSLGMAYFGLMEWLQVFQHIYVARPEDDYAMCSNRINMELTNLGVVHVICQPLFLCMGLMSMYRRFDIQARFEADLIFRLCVFAVLWFVSYSWGCALMGVEQTLIPRATQDCPNYMWLHEGYDGFMRKETPNMPGYPCTYYAPTLSGHLAWAVPVYRQSYSFPGNSLHFFLMFAPYFVMFHRRFVQLSAIVLWLSGPVLSSWITSSVNEQPAVWCFYSVAHTSLFGFVVRYKKLYQQPIPDQIHHPGGFGEQPLTYYAQQNPTEKEALMLDDVDGGESKSI